MKSFKEEDIKRHLEFLLEKVELSPEEMRWLLNYLEQGDGVELKKVLFDNFLLKHPHERKETKETGIDLQNLFDRIKNKLFDNTGNNFGTED